MKASQMREAQGPQEAVPHRLSSSGVPRARSRSCEEFNKQERERDDWVRIFEMPLLPRGHGFAGEAWMPLTPKAF